MDTLAYVIWIEYTVTKDAWGSVMYLENNPQLKMISVCKIKYIGESEYDNYMSGMRQ